MKKLLNYFPDRVKHSLKNISGYYFQNSYSQEGEDLILNRLFSGKKDGFYIDIGAHHPKRFSNTHFFYKKGWHGINMDAMPGSMRLFNYYRKKDINLEVALGNSEQELTYYAFNDAALNSFSKELADQRVKYYGYKVKYTKKIKITPLKNILVKYLPEPQLIDFMSVDVEGLDLEVLQSNDWCKYRPAVVLVEAITETSKSKIENFMRSVGYVEFAKTINTLFFKVKDISD